MAAGQQTGAARPVVDADQGAARRAAGIVEDRPGQADELLGEHAAARVRAAAVDPFQDGPARPLLRAATAPPSAGRSGRQRHRGHGRGQDAGHALAPGPLDQDVDRAVGGGALLPVGGVVRVEDHHGRQPRHGGPGARPGCRPRRASRRGPAPRCPPSGTRGVPAAPSAARPTPPTGRGPARCPPRARTAASPTTDSTRSIGSVSGRLAHHGDPRLRQVEVGAARRRPRRRRRGHGGGSGQARARWSPGTRCGGRTRPGRPSARPPTPPAPPRPGGGPHPSHDLSGRTSTPGGRPDVLVDHPAPHGPPVEGRPHPGADVHVVAPRRRDGVVERLGHGGHLGAHAHHPRRAPTAPSLRHASPPPDDGSPQGSDRALRAPRRSAGRPPAGWPPT